MKVLKLMLTLALLPILIACSKKRVDIPEDFWVKRPANDQYLYDYANTLSDNSEYVNNYLSSINDRKGIDAVLIAVDSLFDFADINEMADSVFNSWKIGENNNGRGLLILLVNDEKKVRLEVSYELEDVFTDVFCGFVEDKQLSTYYQSADIGFGLLAVMEELEYRAHLKKTGEYTEEKINTQDEKFMSGGAGAQRDLNNFPKFDISKIGKKYMPGKTPREAFQTMLRSWRDKVRDPDLGVSSAVYRLQKRNYTNMPDSRFKSDLRDFDKTFYVEQDGDYAVIHYGKSSGWDNQPFLFFRSAHGWQFDYYWQSRLVRMGQAPQWGVIDTPNPYYHMFKKFLFYRHNDIYFDEPLYTKEEDLSLARRVKALEEDYEYSADDFDVVLELGTLYVRTGLGRSKSFKLLGKAIEMRPNDPRAYKYIALKHAISQFQYKTATKYMEKYHELLPKDKFGANFLAILYYYEKRYKDAIKVFETAIEANPDNCYAYSYLSQAYARLYDQSNALDPLRIVYKKKALENFKKAKSVESYDDLRVHFAKRILKRYELVEGE